MNKLVPFISIVAWMLASCVSAQDQPPIKFVPKLLTVDANEGIDLADVDKDGQLDVIAGRNWYPAPGFEPRPLRTIEDWNGYVQSNGDFAYDVDGDGWTDVIAGSFIPTHVHWFKNPGKDGLKLGQLWPKKLLVDTKFSQNEASFLRDMDGDKIPEWISNSWSATSPISVWKLTRTAKNEVTLEGKTIGDSGHGHGMGFGDVNNDGREDVLVSLGWYERPEGDPWASKWKYHDDWNIPQASCPILVRDLNGDGKNDLVFGNGHNFGLYWWESNGEKDGKLQFAKHTIDDRYSQPHALAMVDLDGDGQEELITGKRVRAHNGGDPGGKDMPCMYYYKWDKSKLSFNRFVIDEGHIGTGLQIRSGDLDGDGDIDLAVAGKDGTWLLYNQSADK